MSFVKNSGSFPVASKEIIAGLILPVKTYPQGNGLSHVTYFLFFRKK